VELSCPPGDVGKLRRAAGGSNDVFAISDRTKTSVEVDGLGGEAAFVEDLHRHVRAPGEGAAQRADATAGLAGPPRNSASPPTKVLSTARVLVDEINWSPGRNQVDVERRAVL
jgi:hypothetical protein